MTKKYQQMKKCLNSSLNTLVLVKVISNHPNKFAKNEQVLYLCIYQLVLFQVLDLG